MHFQQVALTVMAFSSARGGTVVEELATAGSSSRLLTIVPPLSHSKITVEQDNQDVDSWYVRVTHPSSRRIRHLLPPVYFPAVTTQQGLQATLARAWEHHRRRALSRFVEPPTPPASSPPRSASPARQQRAFSPQSPPRHV